MPTQFDPPTFDENQVEDEAQAVDAVDPQTSFGYSPVGAKQNVNAAAQSYFDTLQRTQKSNADIMQKAQQVLLQRAQEPMDAGAWFKIAGALGKPLRTGHWTEGLGNVNDVLAVEADKKLKAKRDLEEMQMRYQMQLGAQQAEMARAKFDTTVKAAGVREQPASKLRQLQNEYRAIEDKNSDEAKQLKSSIDNIVKPKTGGSDEKKWAFEVMRTSTSKPESVDAKDVVLAEKILGLDKPKIDKRELWTGDEANASIELFGTTDATGRTPEERKQVRTLAQQIRATNAANNRAPKEDKPAAVDATEYPLIAQQLGVPFVTSPYKGVNDKTAATLLVNNSRDAQKKLSALETTAAKTASTDSLVNQFLAANKKANSGKVSGSLWALSSEAQTMDSVTAKISPENRIAGSGATSDFDAKQLERATLSRKNNYDVNEKIGYGIKAANQLARDKVRFMSDFFEANKHMNGAEREWGKYVNANPIFDPAKPNTFALNPKRKTYKQFFYPEEQRARGGRVGYAGGGIVMSKAEYDRIQQENAAAEAAKQAVLDEKSKQSYFNSYFSKQPRKQKFVDVRGYGINRGEGEFFEDDYYPRPYANGGVVQAVNDYQGYGDLASLRERYAHGGVVAMQEGGDPERSLVRLKRMPPASDAANRARAFFGQGMGMSFGDEAEALYRSMLTSDGSNRSYDNILNEIRADYRRYSDENPVESLSYELAGGVAPTVVAALTPRLEAGVAPQVTRLGQLSAKYAPRTTQALTKTPTRRLATVGGVQGGISGVGAGEEDRLSSGAVGAATGAVADPLIGKGGELLYKGGKRLYNRAFQPNMNMYEEEAFKKVLDKMNQDKITPRQAVGRVAEDRGYMPNTRPTGTRPETSLRDVSPSLTDLAETVANRPSAGRTAMVQDAVAAGRGNKARVGKMVEENVAKGRNMFQTEMQLTDDLRDKASTMYDMAYSFGTVKDPRILDMLQQPAFKDAYKQVLETNKLRKANAIAKGEDPSKFDLEQIYDIREIHPCVYEMNLVKAPDVKTLDQIKRGLDYKIRTGRMSTNAAEQDAAHALNEYKNTFLGILDDTVPTYKLARQTYKGDLEVLDALDFGRNQYGKMSPEAAQDYVSKLTPTEKDALRIGYAQQFRDKIGNAKNSINAAEEVLGADYNIERMKLMFDTPSEFEVFKSLLKAESRNVKNSQQIVAGSATGRRKELQKEFEGDSWASSALDLAGGSPFSTVMRIMRKAPDLFKNEKVAENVSKILNTSKPKELNKVLRGLEARANKFDAERKRIEKIGLSGSRGAGRASGETPIGAEAEEEPMNIPSAVEGGNDGDYSTSVSVPDEGSEEEPREYEEGGYVLQDPNTLKSILNRVSFSGYADKGRQGNTNTQVATGRLGYRQPVGNDSEVGVGLSGLHAKYSGQSPSGQKYSGEQNSLMGADASYRDSKQQFYLKYGKPQQGDNLKFSEAGYSRNLDNDRGTVGIRHSQMSPEGTPDRSTQLFYSKDFRSGGAVQR